MSFLKRDRQGVASSVGTIMALLVFMTFMALLTNSYVPAWMLDNERSHMNTSLDQFGQLKSEVDTMIMQQMVTGDNSIKMYAPFAVGSQGVPIFASPTVGMLSYVPQGIGSTGINVKFNYSASTTSGSSYAVPVNVDGGGKVELYVPNRYYVQQWLAYENGAIILKQSDGQSIRAYPNLDITKVNGSVINIQFTEIDLIGTNQSVTGSDSVGFSMNLIYIDSQKYSIGVSGSTWSLSVTTNYGSAWSKYFTDTIKAAGLSSSDYTLTNTSLPNDLTKFVFTVNHCNELDYNRAFVSMTLLTS